jgi:SAM-dependent methyltransferase
MAVAGEVATLAHPYRRRMNDFTWLAAAARIEEMTNPWALGDYDRFARALVWDFGPELVAACGIGPGQRVLDVAAGTGNVALRAAAAGAQVVACDLTPESLAVGERHGAGLDIEWVQADAQALPFADGEFDAVVSSVGAIFAPDQRAVAGELLRVCRPGGTIGMTNFRPGGVAERFFAALAPYAPDGPSPLPWGDEAYVQELLGAHAELTLTRRSYVERVPGGPEGYCAFYRETFGPLIALRAAADDPDALDRDLLAFATAANRGAAGGDAEIAFEYLLVVAHRTRGRSAPSWLAPRRSRSPPRRRPAAPARAGFRARHGGESAHGL